jgi:murein DD-endopeptidase MepM/ murein hydrolase activator NlpD
MANEHNDEKGWMEKLKDTYRLVIMNNETFEEVGSYKLSLLNVYIAASTIIVVVTLVVVSIMAFTPLRKYIPGYGDVDQNEKLSGIISDLDEMERELNAHRTYTNSFRRMLVDDPQTAEDIEQAQTPAPEATDSIEGVGPSEVDDQLRKEMKLAELGEKAQNSRTTNLSPSGIPLEQMFFTAPITGEISAGFMPDKDHYGVDILAPKNTAIKAVMDGYVFLSDWTLETGNSIGIQHANNVITFYKHNSALLKKVGSYVRAGEAVAIIGNTGTLSDGPHLHFELWYKGNPVDPTEFINF